MSSSLRRSPGFTLVEVMVAVVITGVVSVSLAQMLSVGQRSADRNRIMSEMQQNSRVGIQSLSDDLRHVSYGKDPTQPSIFYAGPDSVEFVADLLDDNAGAERVSYFLSPAGDPDTPNPNDTILMKVVRDTLGAVLYSAPQAYGIAPGGLAFRWFNGGGVELANPVPQPELVGEVMVTLTVAASRKISGAYPQMALSSTIYPRNLPLSPARSRPSNPGFVSLESPNCESATLTWTTPTTNTDATELEVIDIGYFALYLGTDPDHLDLYTKLARTTNQWTIRDLSDGPVYYLAVTCVSRSGVESYRCGGEIDLTWTPVPKAPVNLHFSTGAGTILAWDPVTLFTNDAAIATPVSYRIYRGVAAGFAATDATRRGTVTATMWTDSSAVAGNTYYYRVQAKACRNEESTGSNEVSNCAVNLQLWSNTAAGETMTLLTPTFTGGALVQEVWYGSPLVKIWAGDGSAGGDGNVGARPSGSVLNIVDSAVPFFTALPDGRPLRVVFSSALYGVKLGLGFQGATGFCAATTSPSPAWTVEDFGSTVLSGWTRVGTPSPDWQITSGELVQGSTASSNYLITNDGIAGLGILTMQARVMVTGGTTASRALYLVFREQDSSNYYQFGIHTGTSTTRVLLDRMQSGVLTSLLTTAASITLANNTWYTLRVQVTGGPTSVIVRGWVYNTASPAVNVWNQTFTDGATTWAAGKIGLATRQGAGKFDDLRVYAGSPLP